MNIAYVRSSSVTQNNEYQVEALEKYEIEKWFIEKVSGKDMNRPALQEMLEFIREGDTVYIHDFSRLARSVVDLLSIVERINKKKAYLVSYKENINSSTATGKLMLTMIGAIAEFERANLLERQKEGIAVAKAKGKYKGRQPEKIKTDTFEDLYNRYMTRKISKNEFCRSAGVSFPTLQRFIKSYESGILSVKDDSYYVDPERYKKEFQREEN